MSSFLVASGRRHRQRWRCRRQTCARILGVIIAVVFRIIVVIAYDAAFSVNKPSADVDVVAEACTNKRLSDVLVVDEVIAGVFGELSSSTLVVVVVSSTTSLDDDVDDVVVVALGAGRS